MPQHFARHAARAGAAAAAACALLIVAGCAHKPQSLPPPAAQPEVAARASAPEIVDPITVATVLEVYRTQPVESIAQDRCGEAIAPPPPRSLWSRMFSSAPSRDDVEMPPPVFVPEIACDKVAVRRYDLAHYRIAYRFEGELYMVDLDYDPGSAVRVDGTGRVLGRAELP